MIHVIWNEQQAERVWGQGRDVYTPYLFEILQQAGIAFQTWNSQDWLQQRPAGVTMVAGLEPIAEWNEVFRTYCEQGNSILAVGETYGLDELLGVKKVRSIKEGYIRWNGEKLAEGLRSSFHFFGAPLVKAGEDAETLGLITLSSGVESDHPALVSRTCGSGTAALLTVDLARTVRLIQDGVPVVKDGVPSPDGKGAINDDILKADDGVVLDWERDREAAGGEVPFFIHPIVDEYRILLIRLLHQLSSAASKTLAQVWFWPKGLEAVGHISHDTDGNLPEAAEIMMDRLNEAEVKTSWCVIMPGYPEEIYKRIVADGHEVALHYNALESEGKYWDEDLFNEQLKQLQSHMENLGQDTRIWTNKNHYLRWEGDIQFYRWCEKAGIVMEQSKGGTKQANKGFLSGTCHPYLPASDASERNRLMNVYGNPTLAWDPPVPLRCTLTGAKAILDRCKDVYGVAHFLYHPATFKLYEEVGPSFVELIRYGRDQGLEWWTSFELYNWLELRRTISAVVEGDRLVVTAKQACQGVTVLLPAGFEAEIGGAIQSAKQVERCGLSLTEVVLDVQLGETSVALKKRA